MCLSLPTVRESFLSTTHYGLYTMSLLIILELTYINHHASRRSSTLILLFWPIYFVCSVIRCRTMIITGQLSPVLSMTHAGRFSLARDVIWLSSVGIGLIDFVLEIYSPEKRWRRWRAPWAKEGKIALNDDADDVAFDGVEGLDGGGAVGSLGGKANDDGDIGSPMLTENVYERYV